MALSSLANLAISVVATAPSPATSGTSLVVTTGQGSRFPASGSFPVVIWPTATTPTPANAEIALCTVVSTDTLTITRAQEGTSARTVVIGDQVMMAVTKVVLDGMAADVQLFAASGTWTKPTGAKYVHVRVQNAGGGGGSGRRGAAGTLRSGGNGGNGGDWTELLLPAVAVDSSCTVTVGAGGSVGAAVTADSTNGNTGGTGGISSFTFNSGATLKVVGDIFGATGGNPGGTSAPSAQGITTGFQWLGSLGGLGSDGTASAGLGGTSPAGVGAGGGGGGGGISSADGVVSGRDGSQPVNYYGATTPAGTGGFGGGAGGAATSFNGVPGRGGGGGAASKIAAAGAGGAGVNGGGGGGGGASLNGSNSGAGGVGGDGFVLVTTYF